MKRKLAVVVGSVVLVLCIATYTIFAAAGAVHVQGSFTGTVQRVQISTSPPAWSVRITGPVRLLGLPLATADLIYDRIEVTSSGDALQPGTLTGRGTVTFPNGNQAVGTFRFLTAPTEDANQLAIVGTITVTGGTGVFAGATGSGVTIGRGNVAANTLSLSIDGFLEGLAPLPLPSRRPGVGS